MRRRRGPSGRDVDLPCFQYAQADARYYGIEAEGSLRLATIGRYAINADLLGDYVNAQILGTGPRRASRRSVCSAGWRPSRTL